MPGPALVPLLPVRPKPPQSQAAALLVELAAGKGRPCQGRTAPTGDYKALTFFLAHAQLVNRADRDSSGTEVGGLRPPARHAPPGARVRSVQRIGLASDGQGTRENLQSLIEADRPSRTAADVIRSFPLNRLGVRTSQPCDEGKEALPLLVARLVVEPHGQPADRPGEAGRHVVDTADGFVGETSRDEGRFVDAGSTVPAGERVRADLQLPVQDVIKTIHD